MTSQQSFIWLEYARLSEKDQKETWNNIVETTNSSSYESTVQVMPK